MPRIHSVATEAGPLSHFQLGPSRCGSFQGRHKLTLSHAACLCFTGGLDLGWSVMFILGPAIAASNLPWRRDTPSSASAAFSLLEARKVS